jgi:hypothetical protein
LVRLEKTGAKIALDVGNPRIQLDRRFEFSASSFVLVLLHVERAQVIVDDIGTRVSARKSKQLFLQHHSRRRRAGFPQPAPDPPGCRPDQEGFS